MISNFKDFLSEGKVTVKRRYTENHPSKHVYSGAKIRNAVLSAIKDGVVTEEEFQKILDEAGASRIWKYKYEHLFDVNEDGVKLSSKGLKLCPAEKIEEASTSIAQQRLMGMAYALKTGEMDPEDASDEVKDLANSMTTQQLKDFASTKHKGLPKKKLEEIHKQAHTPHEVPSKNLKGLVKKAVKRIDADVDGDTDHNDKKKGELGEFIPGVGNKRLYSTTGTKTAKEAIDYADSKQMKRFADEKKKHKEQDRRMKFGKFSKRAEEARDRLRPGEVKRYDKAKGKWVSNKD